MSLVFKKIPVTSEIPTHSRNKAFLRIDYWDDFTFRTLFYLTVFDENGIEQDIGNVKIGYIGQETGYTEGEILDSFESLNEKFFSLGQDAEYYKNIKEKLSTDFADHLLSVMRDVTSNNEILNRVENESVFQSSLLRTVSMSSIHGQFKRILSGGVFLTDFNFLYKKPESNISGEIELDFKVIPRSIPSTNIHILIGRNGVGKTTLLNDMINSIVDRQSSTENVGNFYDLSNAINFSAITNDYFSSVTSISFSAFDNFIQPPNQDDSSQGICYSYIGLYKTFIDDGERKNEIKKPQELYADFVNSLKSCFSLKRKKEQWLNAIKKLESDYSFAEMNLSSLAIIENNEELEHRALFLITKMSSGHVVVLLSMTKLVETVEEKTLVLIDEPETHLHPPLLSAFIRALSDLLLNRNGVAIIATHSPVVLQEVPKSCVWKQRRTHLACQSDRPENETFGENVGVLTREIFGLEVSNSGFHQILENSVAEGKTYEQILDDYNNQLGFEGKVVLRALIESRDSNNREL